MKGNQGGLKEALETWLAYSGKARLEAPPDWEEVRKGHGRIEQRQLWLVPCKDEMQTCKGTLVGPRCNGAAGSFASGVPYVLRRGKAARCISGSRVLPSLGL